MQAESDEENPQDPRKQVKKADKEKEFRTIGQLKEVYHEAQDMYQAVQKYSNTIKSVTNAHPVNKGQNIMDFSLNARGPDEDKIYVKHDFYRWNIRRGNTLVVNSKDKKAEWGRKGLMKFFDISQSGIKAIVQEDIKVLSQRDKYNHYAVFTEVENALSCNDELEEKDKAKVHVYRLNKANGENAQVSYFKPNDEWVISSKNVSIMVKGPEQIKKYDGERYQFAKLIAETWFSLIKELKKNEVELLKQDLSGKTAIGEYCGNPDFQHLVKYSQTTIYFYALVENASSETCLPPPEAFKFFEQHKLPIVKNYEKSLYGKFTNYVELGKAMEKLFSEVSRSSIFEEEQGSVVYFVIEKPKVFCEYISDRFLQKTVPLPEKWQERDIWIHVSTLGKLKTLEYRILRKLREKLKFWLRMKKGGHEDAEKKENDAKKLEEKYGSFEKECYQLLKGEKLSKPIEYYFCVALFAFDYVFKNRKAHKNLDLLNDHYLDFLSVIFWCVENKKQVTPGLMTEWKLHEELRSQTWEDYSTEVVKDYETLLNKIVPRYATIKKKMKIGEQDSEEEVNEEAADD